MSIFNISRWNPWPRPGWREKYRRLPVFKKVTIAAVLGVGITLAAGISYLSVSLLLVSPAEVSLAALADSWQREELCHEDCAASRRQAAAAVIADLKVDPQSKAARRLERYFSAPEAKPGFLADLVRILAAAQGPDKPPEHLISYFKRTEGRPGVQAAILASFRPTALDIPVSAGETPLAGYFLILESDRDLAVKQAAVEALSSASDKARNFSAEQLSSLQGLILDPATPRRLRQSLILLLSDYWPFFPDETAAVLRAAYDSPTADDEISRAFSADILNRQGGEALPLPAISPEAWAEYYND